MTLAEPLPSRVGFPSGGKILQAALAGFTGPHPLSCWTGKSWERTREQCQSHKAVHLRGLKWQRPEKRDRVERVLRSLQQQTAFIKFYNVPDTALSNPSPTLASSYGYPHFTDEVNKFSDLPWVTQPPPVCRDGFTVGEEMRPET